MTSPAGRRSRERASMVFATSVVMDGRGRIPKGSSPRSDDCLIGLIATGTLGGGARTDMANASEYASRKCERRGM